MFKLYADAIFEKICPILDAPIWEDTHTAQDENNVIREFYLDRYFKNYHPTGKVGAIVMNCNPFTYGHRYLIEQALNVVNNLIIFVVEEDRSIYTFNERLKMVWAGVSDLKNVTVIPSGPFILSQTTFPEYFIKLEGEELTMHTEYDITLFSEEIAPKLGITYRFVGEEKADSVTRQYNESMKKILPPHGIQVIEIPRKELGGIPISATEVRRRLDEDGSTDNIRELVPKTTIRVIAGRI